MSREWRPGDVALVPGVGAAVRTNDGQWATQTSRLGDFTFLGIRPLVVIDPEDREQVEQLTAKVVEACFKHGNVIVSDNGIHGDTMQAALREFANPAPPKPDEPKGAVSLVEDIDGAIWARQCSGSHESDMSRAWIQVFSGRRAGLPDTERQRNYRHIDAVRVLSEGVTP